ncbi:hypothetical protein L1887_24550 [Cichorium endivia]|nr:hypothetical protein L1887_24550 [Cichorium endivia]
MNMEFEAFVVEDQVKVKSKWFSSLKDISRKLKIMKMDQIKLLEDVEGYKKCAADLNDMSCIIESRIDEQAKQHKDLKIEFKKGAKERKELYNKIQELKGNTIVFCRCRPLNSEEIAEGASMAFDFEASREGELRPYGPLPKYRGNCEVDPDTKKSFCNGKIVGIISFIVDMKHQMKQQDDRGSAHAHGEAASTLQTWNNAIETESK